MASGANNFMFGRRLFRSIPGAHTIFCFNECSREDGCSYASFETAGYDFKVVNPRLMIERVLTCFRPWEFSIAFAYLFWF